MASDLDPEGKEVRALLEAADINGTRVLEVGSGNGRLAMRYAQAARVVVGVDLKFEDLSSAASARPRNLTRRLRFVRASAVPLPFRDESFDLVLFAWSL